MNPNALEMEVAGCIDWQQRESQRVPTLTLCPYERNRIEHFHQQSTNLTFHPPTNKSFSQLAVIFSILHLIHVFRFFVEY